MTVTMLPSLLKCTVLIFLTPERWNCMVARSDHSDSNYTLEIGR